MKEIRTLIKMILEKINRLERQSRETAKKLDEMDKRIKDIDMDVNDLYDDVEGKRNENINKQLNPSNKSK